MAYNSTPFAYSPGVNAVQANTLPGAGTSIQQQGGSISSQADYAGPLAGSSFLGEPFAVWLGFILLLIILKILTEHPNVKLLGENVNPAHIRIGGYNWLVIGVSASTFLIIMKVIFNKVSVPGLTQFSNAL